MAMVRAARARPRAVANRGGAQRIGVAAGWFNRKSLVAASFGIGNLPLGMALC